MRYDNKLNNYRFLWSDFAEWDPGYKKGMYEFTITARKSGYATQQKSYTRIILVDQQGKEYLVYEASFPFEQVTNLEGACFETCLLEEAVVPKKNID